jgi:hypothetical protein
MKDWGMNRAVEMPPLVLLTALAATVFHVYRIYF